MGTSKEKCDMAISNTKAVFQSRVSKVWETVTSLDHYAWRSDLSRVEVVSDRQFVEYTKEGYTTTFTITVTEPYKRWEFDMENDNMSGHWTGIFVQRGEQTEISFTEEVTAKKIFMKPFVKMYLKKQQKCYIQDLTNELQKE